MEMGDGMLNNELYIGRRVWNRRRTAVNPDTRKRHNQPNGVSDRVEGPADQLRVIDDELWRRVKRHQLATRAKHNGIIDKAAASRARRPKFLLSGMIRCDTCGGNYVCTGRDRWRCANFAERGACDNNRSIGRKRLESRVYGDLREEVGNEVRVRTLIRQWNEELGRRMMLAVERRVALKEALAATEKELGDSIRVAETGGVTGRRTNPLGELVVRCDGLRDELAAEEEDLPPKVSVGKAGAYAKKAVRIIDALARMKDDVGVRAAIRQIVGKVVITPTPGREPVEVRVEARIAGVFALEVSDLKGEPHVR